MKKMIKATLAVHVEQKAWILAKLLKSGYRIVAIEDDKIHLAYTAPEGDEG